MLLVFYGVSIFMLPSVASTIDNLIGKPWLSDTLRWKKVMFDGVITDIPSINEVKSGAVDLKDKFTTWVDTTKDTIDSIREWAQKAEDTFNDAKETYEDLKDTFDDTKEMFNEAGEKLEQIQWVVEGVSELTGSWSK